MKIIVEFDSWIELEEFRVSGRKTRGKSSKEEIEEAVELQASRADPSDTRPPQQPQPVDPVPASQQSFTPPAQALHGFPGSNSGTAPAVAAPHPLVAAILAKIDGAVSSGQQIDAVVTWFRQQIGPDAANASLDQIKQVFIPRLTEPQLKAIAPQLGITG